MLSLIALASVKIDNLWVNLLSPQGEQIPPGTYRVTALYENKGERGVEAFKDSISRAYTVRSGCGASMAWRPYSGPSDFWRGRIESSSCLMTVTPATSESVDVRVPTTLRVDWQTMKGHVGLGSSDDSVATVRVLPRPGFTVAHRCTLHAVLGSEDMDILRGIGGSFPLMGSCTYLSPDQTERLRSSKVFDLLLDMEIIETSNPQELMPARGDVKILWTGHLRNTFRVPQ